MQKTPLFVSGIGRSGTSAVISSIAKHKQVLEPSRIGEAPIVGHFINFLVQYEENSSEKDYHLKNYLLDASGRSKAFSKMLSSLQYGYDVDSSVDSSELWIAKVSLSSVAYQKAVEVFDELRIVYVMRNGIEVVNSAKSFKGFAHLSFEQLCKRWASNIEQCRYIHNSNLCAVIRHDELVTDPNKVYRNVFHKLRMSQDDTPANFISTTLFNSSFDKSSALNSTANVFNNRLACWYEWSDEEKRTFKKFGDSLMEEFDFQRPYLKTMLKTPSTQRSEITTEISQSKTKLNETKPTPLLSDITAGHMSVNQFNYYTNVSMKGKYVFIENPKVASTSILKCLQEWEDLEKAQNMPNPHERHDSPIPNILDFSTKEQSIFLTSDEYFRFSFVRNPLTRVLSAYLSKIERPLNPKAEILGIIKGIKTNEVEDINEIVDFPTFVDVICSQESMHMNSHWKTQVDQIINAKIDYSFIGKFENLAADFRYVVSNIFPGQEITLCQSKNKTNSHFKYESYYTPGLVDKIYRKFYEDFYAFEYDKH